MTLPLPRALGPAWLRASSELPVLLLTGPRQVGKTTLLRALCTEDRSYVTLDDPGARSLAREDPELFFQTFPPPVLIDEVQYAPGLFTAIKLRVDQARARDPRSGAGAFWLTGSQPFHLMRGVSETLAGRIGLANLLGFSCREATLRALELPGFSPEPAALEPRAGSALHESMPAVYERIWRGSMPALVAGHVTDRELFFRSYVATYLERDVRDLKQVGDPTAFYRFLRAAAARTGQLLNLSELARDVDITVPTAKSWLGVLIASWQVLLLEPFDTNRTKRLVKAPKLFFLDTGLAAWLTDWSTPEALAAGAFAGPIFETWVLAEILKSYWHRMATPSLFHYRDHDQKEIDLLLSRDGALFPIEIKRAATPNPRWAAPFRLLDRLPLERGPGAVICLAPDPIPLDRTSTVVPVGLL